MKVIVTGGTGLVGSNILRACIANPKITHVVALTRRVLAAEFDEAEKIQTLLLEDFGGEYGDDVLAAMKGAKALLWSVGGPADNFPDVDTARKVQLDYCFAAARICVGHLLPRVHAEKRDEGFRFVFCSGALATRDQSRSLWFWKDTRLIKGQIETALLALSEATPTFETYILRPALIVPTDASLSAWVAGRLITSIGADVLARGMVELALEGDGKGSGIGVGGRRTFENAEIAGLSA